MNLFENESGDYNDEHGSWYSKDHPIVASADIFPYVEPMPNPAVVAQEDQWVYTEMQLADNEIHTLEDADPRGKGTIEQWRQHRRNLRNRVTDGVIIGNRPEKPV